MGNPMVCHKIQKFLQFFYILRLKIPKSYVTKKVICPRTQVSEIRYYGSIYPYTYYLFSQPIFIYVVHSILKFLRRSNK